MTEPQQDWRVTTAGDFPLRERLYMKPVIRNAKDGTVLALVPAGEFLRGGPTRGRGGLTFKVVLPAYYMALHPVTNAQYARFLTEADAAAGEIDKWILLDKGSFVRKGRRGYKADSLKRDHPVVRVSWFGAKAYCRWAGLRLPTESEWEKAARGTDGRKYPWGNDWRTGRGCRNAKNRGDETTCGVWGYPSGASPWGMYQMSGNVVEWCEDWYESGAYARYSRGDLKAPASGAFRVVRGGSWLNDDLDFFRCAYRGPLDPGRRNVNCGFRCARTLL